MTGQTVHSLLQLRFGSELGTVQTRHPFLHQVCHEFLVALKLIVHRKLLFWNVGKVDLTGHVTIGASHAAVLWIL